MSIAHFLDIVNGYNLFFSKQINLGMFFKRRWHTRRCGGLLWRKTATDACYKCHKEGKRGWLVWLVILRGSHGKVSFIMGRWENFAVFILYKVGIV